MTDKSITQLPLFDSSIPSPKAEPIRIEHPEFTERIRREMHNGVEVLSLVDIMAEFSDTEADARFYWRDTKKRLKTDGFDVYAKISHIPMLDKTGKRKQKTDCADGETCLRIVQSIPSPKAEPIRQWLASLGYREIEEARNPELAVRRRLYEIEKYERAGYGNTPEVQRLRARHEGIDTLKELKDLIYQFCDDPNYPQFFDAEAVGLFGKKIRELQTILDTKSVRDALPALQLSYLRTAEMALQELIKHQGRMDMMQLLDAVRLIVNPLGEHLKAISDMLGVSHITGQALLNS